MDTKSTIEKFKNAIITGGRATLHAMKPDEFEYYAFTFELLNSDSSVDRIFHFPVNPNAVSINNQSLVTIRKTSQGFISQISNSFVGKTISISGTFGRRFRLMLFRDGDNSTNDLKLRTGYGATKMMEEVMNRLYQMDKLGFPRLLIFHNYAFNQSLVVEILSYQMTQSIENNMMWNWSIEMKAVGDGKSINFSEDRKTELKKLLAENVVSKSINDILGNLTINSQSKKLKDTFDL